MKNNQTTTGHFPVDPALIQAHSSVYREWGDICRAEYFSLKQHSQGQERKCLGAPTRLEKLMQAMPFDIQRMIGCETMRQLQNFAHDNAIREGRL